MGQEIDPPHCQNQCATQQYCCGREAIEPSCLSDQKRQRHKGRRDQQSARARAFGRDQPRCGKPAVLTKAGQPGQEPQQGQLLPACAHNGHQNSRIQEKHHLSEGIRRHQAGQKQGKSIGDRSGGQFGQ